MWCWRSISCFRLLASLPYMSIRARVIIAVALKQVDHAPYAQASAQRDYKYLQSVDCRCKKCHMFLSEPNFKVPFYRCFVLPQAPIKKPLYRQSTTVKTGMKSSPSPFLFWFYFMGSGGACGNLLLHGGCAYPAPHCCITSFHFPILQPHKTRRNKRFRRQGCRGQPVLPVRTLHRYLPALLSSGVSQILPRQRCFSGQNPTGTYTAGAL